MKTFFKTFTASIVGGFLSYSITRASLVGYLWLTDTQLTGDQRYWVHEQGNLIFLGGMILGVVVYGSLRRMSKL